MDESIDRRLVEAMKNIVWYDGHYDWLMEMADDLDKVPEDDIYGCPFGAAKWHTEEHTIWMLLVGMFGDWGTSIRSGWVEDCNGAAAFIRELCKDMEDDEENRGAGDGK